MIKKLDWYHYFTTLAPSDLKKFGLFRGAMKTKIDAETSYVAAI